MLDKQINARPFMFILVPWGSNMVGRFDPLDLDLMVLM